MLEDALAALSELLAEPGAEGEPARREVAVQAHDRPALLAAWLEELVFLAETEGFVPRTVEALALAADRLEARVAGVLDDPPHLVKAVTYHRLAFARDGADPARPWRARVVLDV